jgi:hypothetical protein
MPDHQTINVTQIQKNEGCMSGCGTLFAVALLLGLAIEYWYISVGLAVLGAGIGFYLWQQRQGEVSTGPPAASVVTAAAVPAELAPRERCENCGLDVSGNFCGHCGAARRRTCAGCGRHGLTSSFCPECGSATYQPPVP